jgi:PKD repeat protein/RNA polymerase subunit RPABC4/transcription elongation factor Spt4
MHLLSTCLHNKEHRRMFHKSYMENATSINLPFFQIRHVKRRDRQINTKKILSTTLLLLLFSILLLLNACYAGTTWNIQTVDSDYVGWNTSIALTSEGNPCISYWDGVGYYLKYAEWTGTAWSIQTVDQSPGYTSLALDNNDYPHISYAGQVYPGGMKYAKWTGTAWSIQTVDSTGDVGRYSSLALDNSGYAHISYYDGTNRDLKYAKRTSFSWSIQTVDSTGYVGAYTSLALDNSGYPHISYYDQSNVDLKYAKWTGTAWSIQTVDSAGSVGQYSSLALDNSGYPHISYYDGTNRDLKYAKWTGTAWSIQTVDSTGDVGSETSLALDNSGYPHISYSDYTNDDLKYAKWTGTSWAKETVDSEGIVGTDNSLTLDSSGNPHISYLDDNDVDLKYAILAENLPPVVSAISGPTSGYRGDTITVTATASDPEGDLLTYEWMIDSTPFPASTGSSFTFTPNNPSDVGAHVIKVRAEDAQGAYSNWKTLDFETLNHPPTLSAITGPTSGYRDQAYTWTATGSDAEGDTLTYEWYVNDAYKSGDSSFTYTFGSDDPLGSNTIKARVKDALGDYSDYSTLTFNLIPSDKVATPTFNPAGGTYSSSQSVGLSCITGDATIRYTTDGSEPSASSTAYSSPITISVTTTVKAKAFKTGMTDSDTATATYTISSGSGGDNGGGDNVNASPLASFTVSPSTQEVNKQVTFNGAGSSDSDGSIAGYAWDFGDGNTGSGETTTHSYTTAGTYTVELTVTDNDEATGTTTKTITITGGEAKGSIKINNGASSTNTATVTLDLADPSSSVVEMRFSNDNNEWSDWQTYAATASWTLTQGDGTKTVYVQFKDDTGQITTYTDTITLSTASADFPTEYIIIIAAVIVVIAIVAFIIYKLLKRPKKPPAPAQLRITAEPANIVADGETKSIITLQLLDKNGKPISAINDTQVQISATKGKIEKPTVIVPKGKDAEKTVIVSSRETGQVPVTAEAEGLRGVTITLNFLEKKRYCMHCGAIMPSKAKACQNCGKAPPAGVDTKVCHNCKSVIPVVAKFCSECGTGQREKE